MSQFWETNNVWVPLNNPNNPNTIGSDGILATRNSGSGARVTQLGLRLAW